MTMILQLRSQLAGAAVPEVLEPSWTPLPMGDVLVAEQPVPGYLARARDAVASHPHNALAYARLAQAAQANLLEGEALDAATHALDLALDQGQSPAAHAAISVLATQGRRVELGRLLDDPRSTRLPVGIRSYAAVAAGQTVAAHTLLSDPHTAADTRAEALSVLAWVQVERGEFAQAIATGRRAQALGGAGVVLYANLGYAHAALGHLAKAIKLTGQALALAPRHRGVALNLVRYLVLDGKVAQALDLLERLRADAPTDIQLALATANVLSYDDRPVDARRVLQRVRASGEWAVAATTPRAELDANLAMLRWKTSQADSEGTIAAVRRALAACDYESLSIAYLLTNLVVRSDQDGLLAAVIDRLQARHSRAELGGMLMLLAVLRHDSPEALRLVKAWTDDDPLNPSAAALAALLVGDLEGDYAQATEIGLRGLTCAPRHPMLVNNTAYTMALAGDPTRAKRLLDRLSDSGCERVEVIATYALAEMLLGHTEQGLDGYRRAFEMALASGDEPLADLVAVNSLLACHRAGLQVPEHALEGPLLERLASAASARPMTWIVCQRLARELHVDPALSVSDASHEFGLTGAIDAARMSAQLFPAKDSKPRSRPQLPPSCES